MSEVIDLGHGHTMRWASWKPDRRLNPQYAHLPDLEKICAIVRHQLRPEDDNEDCLRNGYCEGAANIDSEVTRELFPDQARWQVESWEPLTLSPSLKCHCGDHGHIQNGVWVL